MPVRKNTEQSRNKCGDAERQDDDAFEVDKPAEVHRTYPAGEGSRRRLHHWQLAIMNFPHFPCSGSESFLLSPETCAGDEMEREK